MSSCRTAEVEDLLDGGLLHYHSVCVLSVGRLVAPTLADDYQEDTQEPHLHSSVPDPMDISHGYQLVQGDENIDQDMLLYGESLTDREPARSESFWRAYQSHVFHGRVPVVV